MDIYDTYYVMVRRLMSFLGIWPFQDPKEQFPRVVFTATIIISFLVVEIMTIIELENSLENIVDMITLIVPSLTFSSAYYVAVRHFEKTKITFERITYDWTHISSLEEFEVMTKYAKQTRFFTTFFAVVMYGSCVSMLAPSTLYCLLNIVGVVSDIETLALPLSFEYHLDKKKYFHLMLVHQIVGVLVLFSCAISIYSMFLLIVHHACSVCRAISMPKNTDQWISTCIRRHAMVIQFVDTINESVEMCYLSQIILSTLLVSLSIYRVFEMRYAASLSKTLYNISCIPGPILSMYITCYIGQRLIDHSMEIFFAACQVSYYDTSLKMQKLLLFLILRTAKPCSLSIGRMFISSHEFFSTTIQTSFSYAMVLYTLK